jgi:hypothetical protein
MPELLVPWEVTLMGRFLTSGVSLPLTRKVSSRKIKKFSFRKILLKNKIYSQPHFNQTLQFMLAMWFLQF